MATGDGYVFVDFQLAVLVIGLGDQGKAPFVLRIQNLHIYLSKLFSH